jgi:hypothetical protein
MCRGVWVSVLASWCSSIGPASSSRIGETVGWRLGAFPLGAAEALGGIVSMVLMVLMILVILVILEANRRLAQLRGRSGLLDRL